MNVKTSIEGANSLTKNALDHCIFPITHRDDVQKYGPMIMASGSGVNVVDIHGKTYLDMMSSLSRANSLGYGNEEIARAMYEQAKKLHYVGTASYMSEPMIQLAARIADLAPGRLSKVMFVSGGSEAVETAFKIAKQYHQASGKKPNAYKIISRWNAFHGATMGALSATDWLPIRETLDPRVPGYSFVGNPLSYRNPFGMDVEEYEEFCAKHLERQIQLENPALVAAFIGEPIMQANGAQVPSNETTGSRPRDLHQIRCAHDRRRDHHRLRASGSLVRQRALRHRAGHHDQREGADCRLHADGRRNHARRDRRRDADLPSCSYVQRPCGGCGGRQCRHRYQDPRKADPEISRKRQISAGSVFKAAIGDHPMVGANSRNGKLARGRLHLGQENQGGVRRRHGEENRAAHARSRRDRERDRHEHRGRPGANRHARRYGPDRGHVQEGDRRRRRRAARLEVATSASALDLTN